VKDALSFIDQGLECPPALHCRTIEQRFGHLRWFKSPPHRTSCPEHSLKIGQEVANRLETWQKPRAFLGAEPALDLLLGGNDC
jgi:hypothetical protein